MGEQGLEVRLQRSIHDVGGERLLNHGVNGAQPGERRRAAFFHQRGSLLELIGAEKGEEVVNGPGALFGDVLAGLGEPLAKLLGALGELGDNQALARGFRGHSVG
jgi:hypothetical protein